MNERVNPFKKLQKPGKHVKRIVPGAGTGGADNFRSAEGSGRNRTAF